MSIPTSVKTRNGELKYILKKAMEERTKAEAMSARFRTEHYEMVLKAGDMERSLPKLAWHLEEPRVGSDRVPFGGGGDADPDPGVDRHDAAAGG